MNELETLTSGYKKQFIDDILSGMEHYCDNTQLMELNRSLNQHTNHLTITENINNIDLNYEETNKRLIKQFIQVKKLNGLSQNSIKYYNSTLLNTMKWATKSFLEMNSDDLKEYLRFYQSLNNCSKVTVDNTRRVISSFYNWLLIEEKIIMNPMDRVTKIKVPKRVRKAFTDEEVEILRAKLLTIPNTIRNIAIFELLLSSGLRLSETSNLRRTDISLSDCKGVCMGKGQKERVFYFSEKAKIAIKTYLEKRKDNNKWLFVHGYAPYNKLGSSGLGTMIRELGRKAGVSNTHPHRFRRTLATRLVKKGMPIEQVSKILGHESVGITMTYIETDKELLKLTHQKHTN